MSLKIGYSREDVDFILDHYQDLSRGLSLGDVPDSAGRASSRYNAPGLVLIEMAGEIAARVKMCGDDGLVVFERYGMGQNCQPKSSAQIEKEWHKPLYEIERQINRVKWFCVGSRRKEGAWRNGELINAYELWRTESRFKRSLRLNGTFCAIALDKIG